MSSDAISISDAAAIAIHTVAMLASRERRLASTKTMAETLHVSQTHLAKVMQRLVKSGLVKSVRGPQGGFSLAKDSNSITLLEVYEAIEGPFTLRECLFRHKVCKGGCGMKNLVDSVNGEVLRHFTVTTVSDLVSSQKNVNPYSTNPK